ncbi:replication/maintenance protein RepL [Paraclostridium sp. AKS46]|nr:replication/maintenance protein RepL [Paraclostridium sp. AKS46]
MTSKKEITTTKKVKVVGTQQFINRETGEVEDFQVVNIEDRDFNFHKVWLSHIINSLDLIGNQKTKLAFWIIENLNKENQLIMTYRQISEKSGISYQTVGRTMKALIESNFIQPINQGAYRVNPDVLFKGGRKDRLNVLIEYQKNNKF